MLKWKKEWLKVERNTALLIRDVYGSCFEKNSCLPEETLSKNLWALCRLTWITKYRGNVCDTHWKNTKIPALEILFAKPSGKKNKSGSLMKAIADLSPHLPETVTALAKKDTGFSNLYNAFRNSSESWIKKHVNVLSDMFKKAYYFKNDEERGVVAKMIRTLPDIKKPGSKKSAMDPSCLLTPVLACLDPHRRFPIINKGDLVGKTLKKLKASNDSLENQIISLMGFINQKGIDDAFSLDVLGSEVVRLFPNKTIKVTKKDEPKKNESLRKRLLAEKNEAKSIRSSVFSGKMIKNHNKMSNKLYTLCEKHQLTVTEGYYDALIKQYKDGRDLLIEIKSTSERACLRLAVGQLFDYRRSLNNPHITDMAVLLPNEPSKDDKSYLNEVGIKVLWFTKDNSIEGEWCLN